MTPNIAQAAYDALCAAPPYVDLAHRLIGASTRSDRHALLNAASEPTRAAALAYVAEPEATRERDRRIAWMRADPRRIAALREHFKAHPADFIDTFGVTIDPRLSAKKGRGAILPFRLFPRQRELIAFMLDRYDRSEPGVVVKSRDVGASWIAMAISAAMCIFHENFSVGVASATEVKLDRSGDDATLFYKLRMFLTNLPEEFQAGWTLDKHSNYLRVNFPDTNSSITGEAGDKAGRGSRKSWWIVDEAAHMDGADIDAALAAATDCRLDISSVNGHGTSFAEKALGGKVARFDFSWRDDPRKDDQWFAKQVEQLDPVTLAQEILMDFSASIDCQVIPSKWAQAAVGLCARLDVTPTGAVRAAMDVAGAGRDLNALAVRKGVELLHLESWKGDDSRASVARVMRVLDGYGATSFQYDAIGVGYGIAGIVKMMNEQRASAITCEEFIGSNSPIHPTRKFPGSNQRNEDLLANKKSQAWWTLRWLFENSYKRSEGDTSISVDDCISIPADLKLLPQLLAELSQVTFTTNSASKIIIDKIGDGVRSPNLADTLAMLYSPKKLPLKIHSSLVARVAVVDPQASQNYFPG